MRLLSQFVEAMDLTDLYSTYERINSVSPRTLLKTVLYSYMNGDHSSRSMELNCKRDINFMFLLEGAPAPDHATFARFRSIHFAPCSKRILAEISNALFDMGEISGKTIFIDGTKTEAAAFTVGLRTLVFCPVFGSFISIFMHTQDRYHCKTPLEVRNEALASDQPIEYPIPQTNPLRNIRKNGVLSFFQYDFCSILPCFPHFQK